MANLISSNVQNNEIVKAEDFNNAFDSTIENVAKMAESILESSHDFVIGGKVSKVAGSWNVNIAPVFGVCNNSGIPFCDTEATLNVSVNPGDTSSEDKYGIIEVQGDYITFNEQQRAFNDADTGTITYQYVDTQKKLTLKVQSLYSDAGTVIAPSKTTNWVKIAEIFVPQGANSIDDCTIYNIDTDVSGTNNTGWTNDTSATYDVGYISDLNARFRVQHNADGSHKATVIGASNIKIGVDSNNVNGSILPVGTSITVDGTAKAATDSIATLISLCASKISTVFADYYNKGGKYNFNGEVKVSSLFDSGNSTLTNALAIGAAGDGSAYLKIGNTIVFTITSGGKLQTSGYTATANNDIVTKAVTDAIYVAIASFRQDFDDFVAEIGDTVVYSNNLLSRYSFSSVTLNAISTANVSTLNGSQTMDGVNLQAGYKVLLKDQTDKAENGLWEVQSGAWNRVTGYDDAAAYRYKFFKTTSGTANKNKVFYSPSDIKTYTSGTTELTFNESNLSIGKVANKTPVADSNGKLINDLTGNADTATKLQTARKLKVDLASTTDVTFDGSADQTSIPVDGLLPVSNGGTGASTAAAARTNLEATKVTLNGSYSNAKSFYAPTGAGTAGQVLKSSGGSPSWVNATIGAVCNTAAGTQQKSVTITAPFTLEAGACIRVLFTNDNTYNAPMLKINNLDAKYIMRYLNGSRTYLKYFSGDWQDIGTFSYKTWQAGTILDLIYDGTYFIVSKEAVVCEFTGTDYSYRCYASGVIEQWGYISNSGQPTTLTKKFLVKYEEAPIVQRTLCNAGTPTDAMKVSYTNIIAVDEEGFIYTFGTSCRSSYWYAIGR